MSQQPEDAAVKPILTATVHDVRYLSALLRGVNFVNRATIQVEAGGLVVTAEDARSLLGTAYIFAAVFDEYTFNAGSLPRTHANDDEREEVEGEEEAEGTSFEIPLSTLIECLNIYGTASSTLSSTLSSSAKHKKWRREHDDSGDEGGGGGRGGRGIEQYFTAGGGGGGGEKRTGMRLSFAGPGYPLTLLMCVVSLPFILSSVYARNGWGLTGDCVGWMGCIRAEDASGPTTRCEIATCEAEAQLELPFDNDTTILKIILKSSWLRDALSEIDPSCETLTFVANPPNPPTTGRDNSTTANTSRTGNTVRIARPMLRIQAAGSVGSTEMDYPNDRDVLESFECAQHVRFSYRLTQILRAQRALQSSTKTSLRINSEGLLSLQLLTPPPPSSTHKPMSMSKQGNGGGGSEAYLEFRCLALDEDV
ncbi:hypothetical protein PLICRDRAFT_139696 [Plicaturopsis crispa FD-325 SS-3]|nr:hypothetical protein PLICRDRAFT_139696 [Plicaturopsis crispa FD-325 SS-3]